MFRILPILLAIALLTVFGAEPSCAALQDTGAYSVELPAGWKFHQEGSLDGFDAPDGKTSLSIITQHYEKPDLDALIQTWAGPSPAKRLADGKSFIYEDAAGTRTWGMLADDGTFAEISASAAFKEIGAFLGSLNSGEAKSGLAQIFQAATAPEVVEWLSFAAPSLAGAKDSAAGAGPDEEQGRSAEATPGTAYKGNGISAVVPEGWTAATDKVFVVFTAPNKEKPDFVRASVFKLKSDSYKDFVAASKTKAKQLGGGNIREVEGNVEFSMGRDATGIFTQYGNKCLFIIISGDSDEASELMLSITPED